MRASRYPWQTALWRAAVGAAALTAAVVAPAQAQTRWKPERVVEIIVQASPGSGADRTARVIQKVWQDSRLLDVPVTVMNRSRSLGGSATAGSVAPRGAGLKLNKYQTAILPETAPHALAKTERMRKPRDCMEEPALVFRFPN